MAEESATTSSPEATAADFTPEELSTKGQDTSTSSKETEQAEEPDEDSDFDPTQEEFEITLPKEEKEESSSTNIPETPEKKKEEKKAGGGEEKKTSQDKEKPADQVPGKIESEEAKTPPPPAASPTVKVKIGDGEYEMPEESYAVLKDTIESAQQMRTRSEELARGLIEKPTDTLMDLLTRYFKGDKQKARDHLLKEYADVVLKEFDRQNLPPEQRELLETKEKLEAQEAELKRFREAENQRKQAAEEREALDGFMGEVVRTMKELGMDTTPTNKESKDFAFRAVDELMALRKGGKPALPIEVVKQFKLSKDRLLEESAKKYESLLDDIPDEELFQRHQKLVERLRKVDIAKLKKGDTPAKTAPKPTDGAERETKPRSKYKVLNTTDWDKTWR